MSGKWRGSKVTIHPMRTLRAKDLHSAFQREEAELGREYGRMITDNSSPSFLLETDKMSAH